MENKQALVSLIQALALNYGILLLGVENQSTITCNKALHRLREIFAAFESLGVRLPKPLPERDLTEEDLKKISRGTFRQLQDGMTEIQTSLDVMSRSL